MLTMRMIGQNDYSVREDGQPIVRIRYASERTPGLGSGIGQYSRPDRRACAG